MNKKLISEYSRDELIFIAQYLFKVESDLQQDLLRFLANGHDLTTQEYCERVVDKLMEMVSPQSNG